MENNISPQLCPYYICNRQRKYKVFRNQNITKFEYLKCYTATASKITGATAIPHKSICYYNRMLEKQGLLFEVEKKICKLTGFTVWNLTMKPNLSTLSSLKKALENGSK